MNRYEKGKPKSTNNEKAAQRVAAAISRGKILRAYNALQREDVTVGPYHEAYDRGHRYAILSHHHDYYFRVSLDAARMFVDLVGSTRAREAAIKKDGR